MVYSGQKIVPWFNDAKYFVFLVNFITVNFFMIKCLIFSLNLCFFSLRSSSLREIDLILLKNEKYPISYYFFAENASVTRPSTLLSNDTLLCHHYTFQHCLVPLGWGKTESKDIEYSLPVEYFFNLTFHDTSFYLPHHCHSLAISVFIA